MKKQLSITIKDNTYPIVFSYASVKQLGEFLGEDSFDGTALRVGKMLESLSESEKEEGGQLPFHVLDALGYLVFTGIVDDTESLKPDEVTDVILNDLEVLQPIIEAWADKMPQAKPVKKGNPTARKTAGKKTA